MTLSAHTQLSEADRRCILEGAPGAEVTGNLAPAVQALAHERGWFRLLAPKAYGGAELSLPELLLLEEAIAATDGSLGWTVTLCAGAGWFGGFLEPALAAGIFAHPQLCIGGSGAATGVATVVPGGYRIRGRWAHASGARIATHFTANCQLEKDGRPLLEEGRPVVRAFIVPAAAVTVHDTWHTMGLQASASHAFSIDDHFAPEATAFGLGPQDAKIEAPLYRYPFMPLAEATLAINLCGMARHFMESSRLLLQRRHRNGLPVGELPGAAAALHSAETVPAALRRQLLDLVAESWHSVERGAAPDASLEAAIGTVSRGLAGAALDAVDGLYRFCGLAAADRHSNINRIWRDMHTAGQHSLLL